MYSGVALAKHSLVVPSEVWVTAVHDQKGLAGLGVFEPYLLHPEIHEPRVKIAALLHTHEPPTVVRENNFFALIGYYIFSTVCV